MRCRESSESNNTGADIAGTFISDRRKADSCCSCPLLKESMLRIIKMNAEKFQVTAEVKREENIVT